MRNISDATSIGSMKLKNRLWRSATYMRMADEKGHLTDVRMEISALLIEVDKIPSLGLDAKRNRYGEF